MKKLYIIPLVLTFFNGISQEITTQDALRYATEDLTGTARFRAMSGAFGALGGDLSSINVNPAGTAIFNHNMATVTASSFNTNNKSNYYGTSRTENNSTLDLNQLGAVFVFVDNNETNNWRKISIGLNYENSKNFDNTNYFFGNSSIKQLFLTRKKSKK